MKLKDKVVVITGASSGIGKAAAFAFARKGAKVVITARRIEKLEEIKSYINKFNPNCLAVKADVTKEDDVINLFDKTEEEFGRIDLLINNAGRGLKSKLCDIKCEDWINTVNTNLTSVFLCTREASNRMIKKNIKGSIPQTR